MSKPSANLERAPQRRNASRAWGAACFLVAVCVTTRAHAQTCPVPEGASARLSSVPPRERLEFIRATMDEQARYTSIWKWAWVGIGSATVVVSTAVTIGFAVGNDPARNANIADNAVAAVFSLATPIVTVAFAPRIENDELDALLRETGGGTAGTCLVLARAEELLASGAADEKLATGVLAHVVSILGAGALFAFMAVEAGVATDTASRDAHWQNAVINGFAGVAYAEAQILTTPTGASSRYARYLKGDLHRKSSVRVSVRPLGAGLALRLSF